MQAVLIASLHRLIMSYPRFSADKGYYVESRRGGGGYISIKRLNTESAGDYLMHIIASLEIN